ncbi:MAG: TIM-barrel domain-containing protein [Phycisphaerae bacterium]
MTLRCGEAAVRIEAVSQHVIRVRLAPAGKFGRDFSWAVLNTTGRHEGTKARRHGGNPQSPIVKRQSSIRKGRLVMTSEGPERIVVSTGEVSVVVHRNPCRLEVRDREGHVLVADDPARGMAWEETKARRHKGTKARRGRSESPIRNPQSAIRNRVWQRLDDGVAIYGLGEKTGPLNKRGRAWTMWNTDAYGYGPSRDPIYKSIPFFLSARDGRFHGVFFDNPWRSSFDVGHRERNVLSFGAEGGELNYYVIAGPHPKDVIRRYTDLTGRLELPPLWSLGYHQCRYSYFPESRVREIAATFREKKIPCDVIYFDIDYMDGYRCFTWNPRWFPQPKKLMDDLHAQGFHTVAIIDPAIKYEPGYFVYDQGTEIDAWLTRPDGETYIGRVWPGKAVFPDFTNPKVRDWWGDLYAPFLAASGLDGIWNDMNEPADFDGPNHSVPLDLRHHNEGEPASHLACHNIYGMQMVRATIEGMKRARPNQRPLAITRATYAGGQRYGATWTGDNTSNWEHLRMSVPMVLNLGVSGIPFVGPDIGGFAGGATPELYARWIQVGSLFPFCRTHTAWGNPDQEPWSYGAEVEQIARESLERRYALLPYLYTLLEEATRTGLPLMRPLWLEFPREGGSDQAFMLGPDIHVRPIVHADARDFHHWLPPGAWFDVTTSLLHQNGEPVRIDADLHTLPLFVRAGAIIPQQSPVQSTMEEPAEPFILDVWPFGESTGTLYEDDGATFDYQRGEYRRTGFRCVADDEAVELTISAPTGSYVPPKRTPLVRLHALPAGIERVTCEIVDDKDPTKWRREAGSDKPTHDASVPKPGDFSYDAESRTWLVRMLPDRGRSQRLRAELSKPKVRDEGPVRFDFDDVGESIAYQNDLLTPAASDHGLRLTVHSTWDPYIVLRRLQLPADELPMLHVRLSTEHTARIGVHFAAVQDWSVAQRSYASFEVTADGTVHDYSIDLARVSQGKWTGTVYSVRLDFEDGVRSAEIVNLQSLSFQRRSGAAHDPN